MRKNTKPSKVVVVSVLSEYSLSEVTVSQFTAALNQTSTLSSPSLRQLQVRLYNTCIVFLCVCFADVPPMLLYLQYPLGSVSDDNL